MLTLLCLTPLSTIFQLHCILLRSVLLMVETGVPAENHRPAQVTDKTIHVNTIYIGYLLNENLASFIIKHFCKQNYALLNLIFTLKSNSPDCCYNSSQLLNDVNILDAYISKVQPVLISFYSVMRENTCAVTNM